MFCHVSEAQGACSGARSGMTPSLRTGAPGIPPCSGACLSSPQVLPFNPVPLLPQARGGSHFRAYRARPCVGGRARLAPARFARLIARARRRTHVSRPLPPGSFAAPAALLRRKAERRPQEPPLYFHSTTLFPQSSPRPRDYPARIDRAGLPAYVGHPAARWESGYPSDCKSAYTGSNPVRASNKINVLGKIG